MLIEFGPDGRPSGEADIYFTRHQDAVAAMSRDRQHIGQTDGPAKSVSPKIHLSLTTLNYRNVWAGFVSE